MPSPTSSTRPTSWTSIWPRYCSISVCSTETISSALNLMAGSRDYVGTDCFQLGPDRGVHLQVAHAQDQTAKHVWIDALLQNGVSLHVLAKILQQALALVAGQGNCGRHVDAPPA